MDVDSIVAWWLNAYLRGEMSADNLLAALDQLGTELPSARRDSRLRLATLRDELHTALVDGDLSMGEIELAAARFLGTDPTRIVETRGKPAWHIER